MAIDTQTNLPQLPRLQSASGVVGWASQLANALELWSRRLQTTINSIIAAEIFIAQPLSAFSSGASYTFPAGFTMSSGNAFLPCHSSYAGAQTVTLPTSIGSGNLLWIMDTGLTAGTHNVTVSGTIIGPYVLNTNGQSLWFLDLPTIGWVSR